jgi:hypothetical protein
MVLTDLHPESNLVERSMGQILGTPKVMTPQISGRFKTVKFPHISIPTKCTGSQFVYFIITYFELCVSAHRVIIGENEVEEKTRVK